MDKAIACQVDPLPTAFVGNYTTSMMQDEGKYQMSGHSSRRPSTTAATKSTKMEQLDVAEAEIPVFDAAATKKLVRKVDWFLIPFLSLLYLLSFLDRTNIGNAKLDTLQQSLGMDPLSLKYNIALSVFFPLYVAAEIPSNIMMKRFRPSVWIPSIMVAWAIVCIGMGCVTNYGGLLACRMLLGLAEGW